MNRLQIQKINEQVIKWSKDNDKLVVAIDGYTGVGKTTLLKKLCALNKNILPVHRDDFLIPRTRLQKLLKKTKDKSKIFELDICDNKKLEKLVKAFRRGGREYVVKTYNDQNGKIDIPKTYYLSKRVLLIEGVFMYHPKLVNYLWDKRIYLSGNIKEIDKRRVAREKKRWGKDYFPETHPDSYFRQVTIALKRYQKEYNPKAQADLVVKMDDK